jgi:hypothetical protein
VTREVVRGTTVTVAVVDQVETQISLTPILPSADMKQVLKETAIAAGWKVACDPNELHLDSDEVELTLDLNRMVVVAKAKKTEQVENTARTKVTATEAAIEGKVAQAAAELDAQTNSKTSAEASEKQADLEVEISETLTRTAAGRKEALNELLKRTYTESLKKKAGAMGTVTSIREGEQGDDFELVIKITE